MSTLPARPCRPAHVCLAGRPGLVCRWPPMLMHGSPCSCQCPVLRLFIIYKEAAPCLALGAASSVMPPFTRYWKAANKFVCHISHVFLLPLLLPLVLSLLLPVQLRQRYPCSRSCSHSCSSCALFHVQVEKIFKQLSRLPYFIESGPLSHAKCVVFKI